jgi:hypothetical protein
LSAAALGVARVPRAPVEAATALSIACIALELVRREQGAAPGLAARAPYTVAGCFGLLHGLGFANALADLAVDPELLPSALLGFNLGVELGQLAFVAAVLALRRLVPVGLREGRPRLRLAAHYALGALAMYWFLERFAELVRPLNA